MCQHCSPISFKNHLAKLRFAASSIALSGEEAVHSQTVTAKAISRTTGALTVGETYVRKNQPVYVITLGKAGLGMALALHDKIGFDITRGICISRRKLNPISEKWAMFGGGHPVPNEQSLSAAQACFELLEEANQKEALVIFAVSGGGSAMLEWPVDAEITLADLQVANRILVTCGATISEVNVVRRSFSAVKGGKLATLIPKAQIVTLIISDTNPGDEASVASGPSLVAPNSELSALEIVQKYQLEAKLPQTIWRAVNGPQQKVVPHPNHNHYVLADNHTAVQAAAVAASAMGFRTIVTDDICEQEISDGCAQLLSRLQAEAPPVCLISGGEFSCAVRGDGRGGRNIETVLRCAMGMDQWSEDAVIISKATDGLDGNSRVAGAIADNTTMERGRALGLDAGEFLARSDSFNYLEALRDTFGWGPTHTNVRDIRVLIKTARDTDAGLEIHDFI